MLTLQLLRPKMIIQLRPLPLQYPHELVDLDLQPIEITSIQLIVLVIHEVLEDGVTGVGIIRHF